MRGVNIIKEVDALDESKLRMNFFEEKYGISSKEFYENDYDSSIIVDEDDSCFWKFCIECFLQCSHKETL